MLELSISVKAEASGLYSIVCPPLQAQTPAQAARLDENVCGPFYMSSQEGARDLNVV